MKRLKVDPPGGRRLRLSHFLITVAALYLFFLTLKFPKMLQIASMVSGEEGYDGDLNVRKSAIGSIYKDPSHRKLEDNEIQDLPVIQPEESIQGPGAGSLSEKPAQDGYEEVSGEMIRLRNRTSNLSVLDLMAEEAWNLGFTAWEEMKTYNITEPSFASILEGNPESCPSWVYKSGEELVRDGVMFLPCGLTAGSSVTVVGTPRYAHQEYVPQLARFRNGDGMVDISQFMIELQGLKAVEGEAPPKLLHLNPRLKGDWSRRPIIEHNTCYRMQWGVSQRCDGSPSRKDDDMMIDGFKRCEKWMLNDVMDPKESKTTSWFKRFIGRKQKPEVTWPFPFAEGKMFILTVRAGIEGYHISVGGRHISSFPYRMGFSLEDATGFAVNGDIDLHSVYVTALPTSHRSFSPQRVLEMSPEWKSLPLPKKPVRLFIGVLSASNHFAERMAVRKTWMQAPEIKSSDVVVRFFVALNARKEVNAVLKKEAAYFGDVIILPFMDRYELVVLKTIAICEYGIQNVTAAHIMKCDDDTFVRMATVLREIEGVPRSRSLYMGNLNLLHRPLRHGKWAVSYEEWPEDVYPPYANGPAYIITIDIAKFIIAQHKKQHLRLFKMEDVSMGMWVEQFNSSSPKSVQYSHNWKYCQYGCMEDYFTAHYQSPIQMVCLWNNLQRGRARCCNFR